MNEKDMSRGLFCFLSDLRSITALMAGLGQTKRLRVRGCFMIQRPANFICSTSRVKYATLLIQFFASFMPLWGQNSVARSHFVLLVHQICSFFTYRGLGRTKFALVMFTNEFFFKKTVTLESNLDIAICTCNKS